MRISLSSWAATVIQTVLYSQLFSSACQASVQDAAIFPRATCVQNISTLPVAPLSAPNPNLPWEIRFIYGHHTYNSAAACNQTNGIVVAATPQNVSYNTCTLISSLYGNRYPAAAAIYLGGTSALSEIDVFYATSAQKRCAEGQSTFCNQLGAPGWYCIYNMYLINNMIIVS